MPQDLADAVLQQLRGSPCAELFGDTWDPTTQAGVMKFFGDYGASPDEPYLVIDEIGETYEFYTAGPGNVRPYVATGQFRAVIFATSRALARRLGVAVCAALNDSDASGFAWPGEHSMYIRMASAMFVPTPETAPGSPVVFNRVLTFNYKYQGQL
jgi:hypothetical protein